MYINGGRAAYTHAVADFSVNQTTVRLFNGGNVAVRVSNASVWGMGCGWTAVAPM